MNHLGNAKVSAILIILVTTILIWIGTSLFLSGIYKVQANLFIEDWQQKQTAPKDEAWQTALTASEKANSWYPVEDAFLKELLAKTIQWNTFNHPLGDANVAPQRLRALEYYRQQTALTPDWPKAWFNLLSIKIELQQVDDEFYDAFKHAKTTTQQTPGMHTLFTLTGIQAYAFVNNKTRSDILRNIVTEATSSESASKEIKPLLQAYNLLTITCIYARAIKANTFQLCQ